MSKRDHCVKLAKEDARRFQASEPSLTTLLSEDDELADHQKVETSCTFPADTKAWVALVGSRDVRLEQMLGQAHLSRVSDTSLGERTASLSAVLD